jgi:hypothetical protein
MNQCPRCQQWKFDGSACSACNYSTVGNKKFFLRDLSKRFCSVVRCHEYASVELCDNEVVWEIYCLKHGEAVLEMEDPRTIKDLECFVNDGARS